MLAETYTTQALPKCRQLDGWRAWYDGIFDIADGESVDEGFKATALHWKAPGIALSTVASPVNSVSRTKSVIRRSPVDHWVITVSALSASDVETRDGSFDAPPATPFILSLGEEIVIRRSEPAERVQLILARDSFQAIAPLLDEARGMALKGPSCRLLAEYVLLLNQNVAHLNPDAFTALRNAVQAMLAVCLQPTEKRAAAARDQINVTLMERVRKAVRRNLHSPSFGPARLCREAATSRSQLYRLLENEGGVANYIQRRRLAESFSILCEVTNRLAIGKVAEMLCFADASSFSRAFRREFDMTPSDVRAQSSAGVLPASLPRRATGPIGRSYRDCLLRL